MLACTFNSSSSYTHSTHPLNLLTLHIMKRSPGHVQVIVYAEVIRPLHIQLNLWTHSTRSHYTYNKLKKTFNSSSVQVVSSSTGPHLSALLKDVTVAGVVVARRPRLAVHVRDVRGSWVQLQVERELYVCLENTFLVLQVFVFVLFGWFTRSRVERMWSRLNWSLRFVNTYLADELQSPSSSAVNITLYFLRRTMIRWYFPPGSFNCLCNQSTQYGVYGTIAMWDTKTETI